MPAERVSMRQIREVLRLRFASELPQRAIAKSLGLSQGAVSGYLSRARAAGVSWPLAEDLDDVQLEALHQKPNAQSSSLCRRHFNSRSVPVKVSLDQAAGFKQAKL